MVQKLASEFFGLVSKNKMAATAVLLKFLGTFAAPVYQRACNVHFPNFQDMFIMAKACLGIILDIWAKTRWPPWVFLLPVFYKIQKMEISRKP